MRLAEKSTNRLFIIAIAMMLSYSHQLQSQADLSSHHHAHHHQNMTLTNEGMVMHANHDQLPKECAAISRDYAFTIYAGREYAKPFADKIFGYSDHELKVEPCSRVTVTLVNRDQVRHQWMVHGLPRYLYGQGMFHLEAAGGSEVTGVFIVPGDDATYLIHCDMAQHMEKGMKAQLVVGRGGGNLWAIPGISADFIGDRSISPSLGGWGFIIFLGTGLLVYRFYR